MEDNNIANIKWLESVDEDEKWSLRISIKRKDRSKLESHKC